MKNVNVECAHTEMMDIEKVIPNPRNPNRHGESQINLLAKIIKAQGWRAPITVSKRSGFIVRGHGRLMAARKLGLEQVPVDVQEYESEAAEWADLIADNRLSELSDMDMGSLKDLLLDLDTGDFDMDLTGFDDKELEKLMLQFHVGEAEEDNFDVGTALEEIDIPKTKLGDMYKLGDHLVLCGDSTSLDEVKRLLGGGKSDMLLTDPPYNVEYTGKTKDALTIKNDKQGDDAFRQFLTDAFQNANEVMKPGAVFYIWHADSEGFNFRAACNEVGWKVRQCLIWNKNSMVMGRQDYHWKHEPCLYGWKDGAGHLWASDRKQVTVLDFERPSRSESHPTMKPVKLFAYQVSNNTKGEDVVLDLFGGSGTTIIACEQLNRKCYTMELDPKYCDVIIKRYIELKGSDADVYRIEEDGERTSWKDIETPK